MRVCVLQHARREGPGSIADWAAERSHGIDVVRLFADASFPALQAFDRLIVLGGPMNCDDHAQHPWLAREKAFIQTALDARKSIVGICLGSQLLARVMGGQVRAAPQLEIGWFQVYTTPESDRYPGMGALDGLEAFHWHGDTFDVPDGAERLAYSEACPDQVFGLGSRVLGFQFHLEATRDSLHDMLQSSASELEAAQGRRFVHTAEQIASVPDETINSLPHDAVRSAGCAARLTSPLLA